MAIRSERNLQGMTLRQMSKRSFVSLGHLSEVELGRKSVGSELLETIASALAVSSSDLVIQAGLLMASDNIPDTAEELLDTASRVG